MKPLSGFAVHACGIAFLLIGIPKATAYTKMVIPISGPILAYPSTSVTLKWKNVYRSRYQTDTFSCGRQNKKSRDYLIWQEKNLTMTLLKHFPPQFKGRVLPFRNGTIFGMTIDKVERADMGNYHCWFILHREHHLVNVTRPLTLIVFDAPDTISPVSNEIMAYKGEAVTLRWNSTIPRGVKIPTYYCGYWEKFKKKMIYLFSKEENKPVKIDKALPSHFKGRVKPFEDGKTFGVFMRHVIYKDEGEYYCKLTRGKEGLRSKQLTMSVNDNLVWFRITKQVYRYLYNDASMRWRYAIPKASQLELLRCGYWRRNPSDDWHLQKILYTKHSDKPYPEMYNTIDDAFPEWMVGRISFYWNNNTVGITLEKVMKRDEGDYFCYLEYKIGKDVYGYLSDSVQLRIYDPMLPATEIEKDLLNEVDLSDIDKRNV